jgi:hypothetical protein
MTRSLLAGTAVCAALALSGSAYAFANKPAHRHHVRVAENGGSHEYGQVREFGGRGFPTRFRIPAHPLVWDCVHVLFPQCGRGFDGLNDGSFQ